MTIGHTLITGDDAAYHALDKPALFAVRRQSVARWNDTGAPAAADETDPAYPISAAYDGHFGTQTRPLGAQEIWWYVGTLDTTTVDAILLHIYDADEAAVTVYLSDGATDHPITSIASDYFATAKRLFCPKLWIASDSEDDQRRFTGVLYIKIRFVKSASTCTPAVTEVAAGRQRQLRRMPLEPYDDAARRSGLGEYESKSGIVTKQGNFLGKFALSADWSTEESQMGALFRDWWSDTKYGLLPFIWCPAPKSAPNSATLMVSGSDFNLPRVKANIREISVRAIEQGGSLLVDE